MSEEKRTYDDHKEHGNDMTYENEASRDLSPMVQISLREYDKLKDRAKYITDKDMIACIDKIEELVRALRKHIVRKEARGEGLEKLKKEIDWIKNLPYHISNYFPTVLEDYRDQDNVWYDMPWYDNPTLRKNILTGVFDSKKSYAFLSNILDFMFDKLYKNIEPKVFLKTRTY